MCAVIMMWVWLECMDVVSGWCCKEVYRGLAPEVNLEACR